ncbi:MAG: hypothetical protein L0099_08660 [Acidobacteria bacterium]|nr:hypothetical protein [Acidobacteriota bacterium]
MRRLLAIAAFALALQAPLAAQIRGIPASVTSIGSGGTPMTPGIGASVTSLGPAGLVDRLGSATFIPDPQPRPFRPVHNVVPFFWPVIYQPQPQPPVVVVQAPPPVVVVVDRDDDEDRERREPLVLEWKDGGYIRVTPGDEGDDAGEGESRAAEERPRPRRSERAHRPARRIPQPSVEDAAPPRREPDPETPATVLVYRDGRRSEVRNYAIVGELFYDLSDRLPRKILLSSLDLDATTAANEERGVEFRLPTASSPNQVMTRP